MGQAKEATLVQRIGRLQMELEWLKNSLSCPDALNGASWSITTILSSASAINVWCWVNYQRLQEVNPGPGGLWIRRPATLFAQRRVVRVDQGDQRRPGHDRPHLRMQRLAFALLLGVAGFVIREAELLAAHHLSACLGLRVHSAHGSDFPESHLGPAACVCVVRILS